MNKLIFRSNIDTKEKVEWVCEELLRSEGIYSITVDLEDWEKIVCLECSSEIHPDAIEKKMSQLGLECSELE